jgi:hypothetical protein
MELSPISAILAAVAVGLVFYGIGYVHRTVRDDRENALKAKEDREVELWNKATTTEYGLSGLKTRVENLTKEVAAITVRITATRGNARPNKPRSTP